MLRTWKTGGKSIFHPWKAKGPGLPFRMGTQVQGRQTKDWKGWGRAAVTANGGDDPEDMGANGPRLG